ncbi:MAG: hypothetical protein MHM6MM_005111 [Cercozoa sp. M6MM]
MGVQVTCNLATGRWQQQPQFDTLQRPCVSLSNVSQCSSDDDCGINLHCMAATAAEEFALPSSVLNSSICLCNDTGRVFPQCVRCRSDFYETAQGCIPCPCMVNQGGVFDGTCSKQGRCKCIPGTGGAICQHRYPSSRVCPLSDNVQCSGNGVCNRQGVCECDTGFTGNMCNETVTIPPELYSGNTISTSNSTGVCLQRSVCHVKDRSDKLMALGVRITIANVRSAVGSYVPQTCLALGVNQRSEGLDQLLDFITPTLAQLSLDFPVTQLPLFRVQNDELCEGRILAAQRRRRRMSVLQQDDEPVDFWHILHLPGPNSTSHFEVLKKAVRGSAKKDRSNLKASLTGKVVELSISQYTPLVFGGRYGAQMTGE